MGSIVGKAMDENMEKQQAFMLETQHAMFERQQQQMNYMREKQMSMMLANSRELLNWTGSFYVLALVGMLAGFRHSRNRAALAPILPLTFIIGYQADMAYGTKLERIKDEADRIVKEELSRLSLPGGLPTVEQVDKRRQQRYGYTDQ